MIAPIKPNFSEFVATMPGVPGVYLMKDGREKIIYVGKAKNLKSRVKSYLTNDPTRYQLRFLMKRVVSIDYLVCQNEKEALLLENSLIKQHKPRYNLQLKDDKSYVSLKLGMSHPFPRLEVTRHIKKDGALYFGPYTSAEACRGTLDLIYRNFKLLTCSDHEIKNRSRPCLEYQIKRCTAPCVGYVDQEAYAFQVTPVRLLLEGKNNELLQILKQKMEMASAQENFEEAASIRDAIQNVSTTLEKQNVVKHMGRHQDVIVFYQNEDEILVSLFNVREGTLIDSHYYFFILHEPLVFFIENFVNRYYLTMEYIPDEILMEELPENYQLTEDVLSEKKVKRVIIFSPQKGEKFELLVLAKRNAQSQYARVKNKNFEIQEILEGVRKKLGLSHFLHRIECYDISNISGKHATGSRVVFYDGVPQKSEYRQYKIKLADGPNDYAMLKEVLLRRFEHALEEKNTPDLLLLDGGKGQLNIVKGVLDELHLNLPFASIAKGRGRGARAKGVWEGKKEEEIYIPGRKNPIPFKSGCKELMLLQKIRDEAHRFAIKYHRKLREG